MSAPEIIEIIQPDSRPGVLWTPIVGTEVCSLIQSLHKLSAENKRTLQQEAVNILSRCHPPTAPEGRRTGLVIGYVQSGKTMSFTTVSALARDNGYRLIILLSGMTVNLFKQSTERIEKDLRLNERTDRKWQFFANPKDRSEVRQRIEVAFRSRDITPGAGRKTVLITVMKNRTHLNNLVSLLSGLSLKDVPTLIIDDEADQASLNNLARKGKESATYSRIIQLRRLLPHHTYLQYTATPQAPLLIDLIDILSPEFAELLTPGAEYTGGRTFFEGDFSLIRRIRPDEIGTPEHPLLEPPDSLLEAMRLFYIGVAVGFMSEAEGNRSMMIHPSRETMQHASYTLWAKQVKRDWVSLLSLDISDPDRAHLLEDFRVSHDDLAKTVDDLPSFEEVTQYLRDAISDTIVMEVNAARGKTERPDFRQDYAHIVVGGDVLNRGFTVEGLTVTYIPRGRGVGNADTIQQRARWFGYKAEYLGFCRVYLEDQVLADYRGYVEHEENVRAQIREHQATGKPLQDWRRAFLLPLNMRPTRNDVLVREYLRDSYSDRWFAPSAPHHSMEAVVENRRVITAFLQKLSLQPDEGHPERTDMQRHQMAGGLSLRAVYEELLTKVHLTSPADASRFTGLLLQIQRHLQSEPDATCTVYQMAGGTLRVRGVDKDNKIPYIFQGPYPVETERRGEIYPGDEYVGRGQTLTVQIHRLNVRNKDGEIFAKDVPAVAVWIPERMGAGWLSQHHDLD